MLGKRLSPTVAIASLTIACGEGVMPVGPDQPSLSILDAVHGGGNEHFYWLPPMVPSPSPTGVFDGSLQPVVEICEWNSSCAVTIARFTMTDGPGSETVRLVSLDEHYVVNWHTDQFALDANRTYRILVRVDDFELGHADVDVVENGGQLKNVLTNEFIPLVDGRTLPIKFRIEEGARPAPEAEWIRLLPSGTIPSIRGGHSAVYDQTTNRLIVYGGRASGSLVSEVWVLENANGLGGAPAWTLLRPTGSPPPGRLGHSAVYDPSSNRMIIFAGTTDGTRLNDTWVLTNANGTELSAPSWQRLVTGGGPPALRVNHSVVYDPGSKRMVVFGGEGQYGGAPPNVLGDVWVLANADGTTGSPTWFQLAPLGEGPSARTGAVATFDETTQRMILFGGSSAGCEPLNDVWVLDGAIGASGSPRWLTLPTSGAAPEGRIPAVTGYRSASNRLVIFGGYGGFPCLPRFNDVWVLSGANGVDGSGTWRPLVPAGGPPPARTGYLTDTYDELSNRLIVFGGVTGPNPTGSTDFLNDLWVLVNADGGR